MDFLQVAAETFRGTLGEPDQESLIWAREMQAMSFIFHIPLVCFGIAFPAMVLYMERMWRRTGDPVYKAIAKRWSKVMLIFFAVGVVTGTILSFQFGLLWPNFTASFGEVFGVGFAMEGFSFFLEAIFITIYVYGWDRLTPRMHFLSGIPIVITGVAGSLFVISVNAWMNNPSGFEIVNGEITDVDPWGALFNSHLWYELTHMYIAGFLVAGFLVAGVYAWSWMKGRRDKYVRAAMIVPLTFACLLAPVQLIVGDWAARTVAEDQPLKLAAFEGLNETTKEAPFTIGGLYIDGELKYGISIPYLLSILADHDPGGTVEGLNIAEERDRPPVNPVHLSFQAMAFIGTALALITAIYLFTWFRRGRLPKGKWFYRAVAAAGPLAVVALICGWITTEVGRQPWVVYEIFRTEDAVTDAGGLPLVFAGLAIVYLALLGGVIWLLRRLASRPAHAEVETAGAG
ncbi:MAG TPA: cytochrome ubiquinol oxidase subunit I [Solirubrobacterales bacterium]